MAFRFPWSNRHTALTATGLATAAIAPLIIAAPAHTTARATFLDVSFSHWARPFIEPLASFGVMSGFADGTFRPSEPVTRSEFESIMEQAFGTESNSTSTTFEDAQPISRMQALVTLSNHLDLDSEGSVNAALKSYRDAVEIPIYAREGIAAATQNNLVVNYPNPRLLQPNQSATRADVAAFVHQALVQQGQFAPLDKTVRTSDYIVKQQEATNLDPAPIVQQSATTLIAQGTKIPLEYPGFNDINFVIVPGETYATTLAVAQPVLNHQNQVLIPEGSRVSGQFVPTRVNSALPATRFVADQLMVEGQPYPLNATSNPKIAVSEAELDPEDLGSTVISNAARSIVKSVMLGKPTSVGGFLSDSFGLSTSSSRQGKNVIVVEPENLTLTTQDNLRVPAQ